MVRVNTNAALKYIQFNSCFLSFTVPVAVIQKAPKNDIN